MPSEEWVLLSVSGRLKSIVRHRIWGLGKMASCAKDGWTDLNDLYIIWRFCARNCLLEVAIITPALKFLVALIF